MSFPILSRVLEGHGFLVEGSTVLSKCYLNEAIPYKYTVDRGQGSPEYEFIYKNPAKKGQHVNRCLVVKSTMLDTGGECGWSQWMGSAQLCSSELLLWLTGVTKGLRASPVRCYRDRRSSPVGREGS